MSKGFTHESTYNESKEWYTPRYIFGAMGIDFDLDPCSPGQDVVRWIPAAIHYTLVDDGLTKEWFGNVWVNPPYGMDTPQWMARLKEHGRGIALVFARTDTQWFHDFAPYADAICFLKGRVQFVKAEDALMYGDGLIKPKGGCGAGSMLIAYGEDNARALYESGLGLTLPVGRLSQMVGAEERFGGDKAGAPLADRLPANENPRETPKAGRVIYLEVRRMAKYRVWITIEKLDERGDRIDDVEADCIGTGSEDEAREVYGAVSAVAGAVVPLLPLKRFEQGS